MNLKDLPLWRLLVALDDAERVTGPDSPTSRTLARTVRERLREHRTDEPAQHYGRPVADRAQGGTDAG